MRCPTCKTEMQTVMDDRGKRYHCAIPSCSFARTIPVSKLPIEEMTLSEIRYMMNKLKRLKKLI